jgi:hypothetical protein
VVRSTGQYPAPPPAILVAGHRARRDGPTGFAPSFPSAGYPTSETIRRPSHLHVRDSSGRHLHARNQQRGQGLPGVVDHPQRRPNVHVSPHSPLHQSDLDRLSLASVLKSTPTSFLSPPPTNNNSALVSPIREHHDSESALLDPGHNLRQFIRRVQPPTVIQSDIVSSREAQQPISVMFNTRSFPVNDPQYPNHAASEPRFVAHDEVDPEKRRKRTDRVEDKQRKEAISKLHGACFGCKKAKKQCNGQEVCSRCRGLGVACFRTCSACQLDKKLACDDVVPCKNCQISGMECIRPSSENITTPRPHRRRNLPPASPSPQAEPPKSSVHLKSHTMLETQSDLGAPAAWHFGFEVKHDTQQGNKRRHSQSLQVDPLWSPLTRRRVSADLPSDESARGVNSDSARVGSRRYSQQFTDVDPYPSLTQASTAVVSEKDSLKVHDREYPEIESCSSHFEDAWCDEDRSCPQPKGVTGGSL